MARRARFYRPYNLPFRHLRAWQQDNKYIWGGYRQVTTSYTDAIRSLAHIHNQTCNIYTHLLAIPLLYIQAAAFLRAKAFSATREDYFVLGVFLAGATVCFGLSAAFHTLSCHSAAVYRFWIRMDYVGIITLTVATFVAGEFYLFYCDDVRRALHIGLTVSVGTATIMVLSLPRFQKPKWRSFRLKCFCAMGLSGFVPMIDALANYGWNYSARYSVKHYLFEMLLESCGALTYGTRIPERWYPGQYDIWGSSHQWFHVFSASAAMVHLAGLVNAIDHTRELDRCKIKGHCCARILL